MEVEDTIEKDIYAVDVHKANAYSETVKFDVSTQPVPLPSDVPSVLEEPSDPEVSTKSKPPKQWELDVRGMINTEKWLQNYGLRRNRLDMASLLPVMGFKHAQDYDFGLKKPISSRYGDGLFQKFSRSDGQQFNITCSKEKLKQLEHRLQQAIILYKRRLEWLTTESRRIFGVIEEHCITIVLDIRNLSPQQFDQYRCAVERVLKEQVSQLAKFNLIRSGEDMVMYQPEAVPVTQDTMIGAISWLWSLDRLAPFSKTATCEALIKALTDRNIESIYLFTEGSSSEGSREILRENLTAGKIPVHVVSYNCSDSATIHYLKQLATVTGGRFHAYAVVMEMDSYEGRPVDMRRNRANIVLKKKTYGGVPQGAGVRTDVLDLFQELEEARNNLAQVQALVAATPDPGVGYEISQSSIPAQNESRERGEQYMSSKEWLSRNGLVAKKLGFYDILSGVAFKHCDGVVDVREKPCEADMQTDAAIRQKLVNAKYCERFAHVRWKDGRVVHVQVTPEVQRNYEQRVKIVLDKIQHRIDWLQQGSRELFGTVLEDQVYFLVDTSQSMAPSIQFVKDKLFVLMQEQLRHKQKFNLIGFGAKVMPWRDRAVEVNERSLKNAWTWIQALQCQGSTNTMSALRFALADHQTQAIYLLTDGRPDQPPNSILAQVQLQTPIPIHTIAFNCADKEANAFLCQLARDTGGRYHYFSEHGTDPDSPDPWERDRGPWNYKSEDIRLLKEEYKLGVDNLEKVSSLREECQKLAWKGESRLSTKCSRQHYLSGKEKVSSVPALDSSQLYRSEAPVPSRPKPPSRPRSATGHRPSYNPAPRPSSATGYRPAPHASHRSPRPQSARDVPSRRPLVAGHTRTSLLRTLSSGGRFSTDEWLLPETRQLLERQWQRQQEGGGEEGNNNRHKPARRRRKSQGSSLTQSSRQWLSKHGLSAKRLTIIDALGPAMIPHKAKYVPILDKHVLGKVFDEVMPLAHVSGTSNKTIHLVNPAGVNLQEYEDKVKVAIDLYKKRLSDIVWRALPQAERDEFNDKPDFEENKLKLMQALDRCGWPVKEGDIDLLEREIQKAEKYLQQSQDLRKASKLKSPKEEDAEFDDAASLLSEVTLSNKYEGLGDIVEKKTVGNEHQGAPLNSRKVKKVLDTLRGQSVVARYHIDGLYYQGFVIKSMDVRHAKVELQDIGQLIIPTRFIIPVGGAVARPVLRVGDHVMVHVVKDGKLECYVPAVVQVTPRRIEDQAKFYTVMMYNGAEATAMRSMLIKISKSRYSFSVRYIDSLKSGSTEDEKDSGHSANEDKKELTEDEVDGDQVKDTPCDSHVSSDTNNNDNKDNEKGSEEEIEQNSDQLSDKGSWKNSSKGGQLDKLQMSNKSDGCDDSYGKDEKRFEKLTEYQVRMEELQKQLLEEYKKQAKQQKKLRKETRRLAKTQRKILKKYKPGGSMQFLKEILATKNGDDDKLTEADLRERVKAWMADQNDVVNEKGDNHLQQSRGVNNQSVHDHEVEQKCHEVILDEGSSDHLLGDLKVGEEVLARWSDDGWYYRGTVKHCYGDGHFSIEDSTGSLENIARRDIISDDDDSNNIIKVGDTVVALHPAYSFSYAPATVTEVFPDLWTQVRMFDGTEDKIPRDEVYKLLAGKYEAAVDYISSCENRIIKQAVVARDNNTGCFCLGSVKERVGNGRQYVIEWPDSSLSIQSAEHMFGAFTKWRDLQCGERVLAMADVVNYIYLPGWIKATSGNKFTVKFCNGKLLHVEPGHCFWLSQLYYDNAVAFYRNKNQHAVAMF